MYRGGYLVEIEDRGACRFKIIEKQERIWEIKKQEAAKKG